MTKPVAAFTKTRLAPTPSGLLHLGNVLSFAITAALAKKTGAKILLRIDDLDRARADEHCIRDIFETLHFLGISWDEGPRDAEEFEANYSQLRRMALYTEALNQMADEKLVYACACSRTQLSSNTCNCQSQQIPLSTPNVSWRSIIDKTGGLSVKTHNGSTITAALPPEMQNFIVKKKDGFPAYQLTSVIDDIFYGVDLIVRGQDLWPSTLAQQVLAIALGKNSFQKTTFYHHALIKDESGRKLSKSAGDTSIKYLRESGKSPAEIYSQIASLTGINEKIDNWQQLGEIAIDLS